MKLFSVFRGNRELQDRLTEERASYARLLRKADSLKEERDEAHGRVAVLCNELAAAKVATVAHMKQRDEAVKHIDVLRVEVAAAEAQKTLYAEENQKLRAHRDALRDEAKRSSGRLLELRQVARAAYEAFNYSGAHQAFSELHETLRREGTL